MTKRHGFTLVELLVVVAIIGILAALLVPAIVHFCLPPPQKVTTPVQYQVGNPPVVPLPQTVPAQAEKSEPSRHYVTLEGHKYLIILTDPKNPQIHPCD